MWTTSIGNTLHQIFSEYAPNWGATLQFSEILKDILSTQAILIGVELGTVLRWIKHT